MSLLLGGLFLKHKFFESDIHYARLLAFESRPQERFRPESDYGKVTKPPVVTYPHGLPGLKHKCFTRQNVAIRLEIGEVLPADRLNVSPSNLVAQGRFLKRGDIRFVLAEDRIVFDCRLNKLVVCGIVFLWVHAMRRQMIHPQALDPAPADAIGFVALAMHGRE